VKVLSNFNQTAATSYTRIHTYILILLNRSLCLLPLTVPYTVTKNVSFDFITTALYLAVKGWNMTIDANMKLLIPLVSAFAASVLSTVTSQPGDMLLSAVNAHEGDQTVWDFSRDIREKEGLKGYFRGMRARFLHVGLIVTAQLLIYDIVKRLVGIAATGST